MIERIDNFNQQKSLTVTILVNLIKNSLETEFIKFWVQGEISNLNLASSGHYYFNLKDSNSQIKCVIFKFTANSLSFNLIEGQEIELTGTITVYTPRGDLQIIVESIRKLGLGKLYEKFEALKQKLQQEGYFSNSHKKEIPKFPQKIGIITSVYSAAIKDVIATIKIRNPSIDIIIYPTPVQGIDSHKEIANSINIASIRCEVDVLILCRGGGSIDDLWSFNEEIIVKSIYNCTIPIVCGVGHESDFTLADFVADVRAATPTFAAQIVTPNKNELLKIITLKENIILQKLKNKICESHQYLDFISKDFLNVNSFLSKKTDILNHINKNLKMLIQQKLFFNNLKLNNLLKLLHHNKLNLNNYELKVENLNSNLNNCLKNYLNLIKEKLFLLESVLNIASPQRILDRGFSLVKNYKGKIIKNSKNLSIDSKIFIQFSQGSTIAKVIADNKKN